LLTRPWSYAFVAATTSSLVAATAEPWGLTILHAEADFDSIARVADVRTIRAGKT
jgi:hypothetical protein